MTSYELSHFKKRVRVWETKSLLFCLRYDPLIVFRKQNLITFIKNFFHKNDVTWPLYSANGLFYRIRSVVHHWAWVTCVDVLCFQTSKEERLRNGKGGGGVLGLIFAGYVPLASQNSYPIIVYSVAKYRPLLSQFGKM